MRLRTPAFWYGNDPVLPTLLFPFSLLYRFGRLIHVLSAIKPYKPSIPVICIGNLTAGGSGKTPAAIAIMKLLQNETLTTKPCFLSRGYGGRIREPHFVDRHKDTASLVGDEPLLLARVAPTIISANRKTGAVMAEQHNKDMIVMDDGMQNPRLLKTLNIAVIDGSSGFGNRRLLPAGPLREPLHGGLRRADAFILIGGDAQNISSLLPDGKPLFRAKLEVPDTWISDNNSSYIAFSGLGRPEKFRHTLEQRGLRLAQWHSFPDHYMFSPSDLQKLDIEAQQTGARLITTEKDATRLPRDFTWKSPLDVMPVELVFDEPERIKTFLKERIDRESLEP